MTFMGKLGWFVSLVLAAVIATGVWLFIKGDTVPASDGRASIRLSEGERDKVLGEMRGLLEAAQAIIEASVANDMATVEAEARKVGMAAAEGESPALMAKLPLEFPDVPPVARGANGRRAGANKNPAGSRRRGLDFTGAAAISFRPEGCRSRWPGPPRRRSAGRRRRCRPG